ncbi:MAG: copper resistance CopC family protein [Candidatus Nanopelagicales bacterium]|jgi:methionine-rich copper-binding protein CopC
MKTFLKPQRIIGAILLAALGIFAIITPAAAHTDLVSTSPTKDSDVLAAQDTISLTFSEPPLVDGAAIVVMTSAGDILDSPAPALDGASLSIPWPADLTTGIVTVQWRATAQDGHVESGEFLFNYTAAAEGGMAASPAASAVPSESAEPMMTALATPEVVAMPLAIEDAPAEDENNLVVVIAIVSLAGLVAAGLYLRRSK